MKNKLLIYFIASASLISVCVATVIYFTFPVIRVARIGYVLDNYAGTVQASRRMEKMRTDGQMQLSSLRNSYDSLMTIYRQDTTNNAIALQLSRIQQSYHKLNETNSAATEEHDISLSSGVLSQLNSHLDGFCKEKGVDILLGHISGEGVVYAMPAWDVTEELLEYVNSKYEGN